MLFFRPPRQTVPVLSLAWALACDSGTETKVTVEPDRGPAPEATAPGPRLKRLTAPQYRRIVADVFSPDVLLPATL